MPLSHLTLTVSHLPTSTSFFLSCLQPLGYRFVGRHDNHVGFGSVPGEPADFWISEERPGIPAGAAHVAFPSPSREAVGDFFIAALKAGGKIHGEPALRDSEQNYYSAAVIDMDGNSIEAVHRPVSSDGKRSSDERALTVIKNGSVVSKASSKKTESVVRPETIARQKSEVGSSASKARTTATKSVPPPGSQQPKQPPSIQLQQPPTATKEVKDNESNGAKAVVGTLIGAAAGAAFAYAMMKGDSQSETTPPPQYSEPAIYSPGSEKEAPAYKAIEAAPAAKSTVSGNDNRYSDYARSVLSKNPRASTIMEGIENGSKIWGGPRSIQGDNEFDTGRRASSGSVYSGMRDMDMPIRAIEPPIDECTECAHSYPNNPSTFISSFKDRPRRQHTADFSSSGHSVLSSSTMKPKSHAPSRPSSHHSHSSRSVLTIKDIHNSKSVGPTASFYSGAHSARNIPLPSGSVTTISTSSRRNSHAHNYAHSSTSSKIRSRSPRDVPLPASTIFLDGVDVDSHVMPHGGDGGGSGGSRVSRKSHQTHHTHRSRSSQRSKKSSKFDEPVRPSDSVSQVSTNVSKKSSKSRR